MAAAQVRVLHVADKFSLDGATPHGVSRLFSWWFPRFDPTQFGVELCGLRAPCGAAKRLEQEGLHIHSLGRSRLDPRILLDLVRLIRAGEFQIIHLHGYGSHLFGSLASFLTGVPTVLHEHFVDPKMPWYMRWIYLILGPMVRVAVANCDAVRTFMVREMHIARARVTVIYNGVPIREFRRADPQAVKDERQRWGVTDGDVIIGSIGRLHPQKGFPWLLEASVPLLAEDPRRKVMIVGDGPQLPLLRAQAERLGISDRVIFTGFSPRVPELLSLMDVVVIASIYEGTTLTVFEAMSAGRPIVSTSVDGLQEVLRDGENATLVPARSADRLTQAIGAMLARPDQARRLADQAKRDCERFEIQRTVDALQDLYRTMLGDAQTAGTLQAPAENVAQRRVRKLRERATIVSSTARFAWPTRRSHFLIVTYHRVLDQPDPYYGNDVPVARFEAQLQLFARHCSVLPLDEIIRRVDAGRPLPRRCLALTFDDGYRDTLTVAWPRLRRYGLPATLYVTAGAVEHGLLWPDVVRASLRRTRASRVTLRQVNRTPWTLPLDGEAERLRAVWQLDAELKRVPDVQKEALLDELTEKLVGATRAHLQLPRVMLSWDELRTLAADGMSIGAHTMSHSILTRLPEEEAVQEIVGSRKILESHLRGSVHHFAYPNGQRDDVSPSIRHAVEAAGFTSACTTMSGLNDATSDRFLLKRIDANHGAWTALAQVLRS